MRRDRITPREIESEMRLSGIANMREVAPALLEPKGRTGFTRRGPGSSSRSANRLPFA